MVVWLLHPVSRVCQEREFQELVSQVLDHHCRLLRRYPFLVVRQKCLQGYRRRCHLAVVVLHPRHFDQERQEPWQIHPDSPEVGLACRECSAHDGLADDALEAQEGEQVVELDAQL